MSSYRGPNGCNVETRLGPTTVYLGRAQIEWLKDKLEHSHATWKVIAADMPLGLAVADGTGPGGCPQFENSANGDGPVLGRELEIAEVLSFIKREQVRNVVWITADVHYCAAHRYGPPGRSSTISTRSGNSSPDRARAGKQARIFAKMKRAGGRRGDRGAVRGIASGSADRSGGARDLLPAARGEGALGDDPRLLRGGPVPRAQSGVRLRARGRGAGLPLLRGLDAAQVSVHSYAVTKQPSLRRQSVADVASSLP